MWNPAEGALDDILRRCPNPLAALTRGEIPAVILRRAYPPEDAAGLIRRFVERGLLYDPAARGGQRERVDIGTSFGNRGANPDDFFAHVRETEALFQTLFDGSANPVGAMREALNRLAPGKRAVTAREPDGRRYGPAIFRCYHEGLGHPPHFDSVAKRAKWVWSQTARFTHQLAGVLCVQNPASPVDTILYRCPWTPEIQPILDEHAFGRFAEERNLPRYAVRLNPGDLYFFFSENIHEVPAVAGDAPRVVLAAFIGWSEDDPEMFVWS